MARVRFTHDFDYKPAAHTTIAYKVGMELTVKQDCADQAIAAGKAVARSAPKKKDAEAEADAGRG